jgi:hypothetical protein
MLSAVYKHRYEMSKPVTVASSLRRILSSLARNPGSLVRIPLRAWMFSVCVCAFFCICVQV